MKFSDLGLIDPILQAVADVGYEEPSPIQAQAIPPVLEGKDLIGCAQTGTGKTAAFAMPVLQRLNAEESEAWCPTRALILTPTRELALQICESFEAYGKHLPLKVTVVFGGVPQHPQEVALRHGVDILVATPGRLLDLVGQQLVDLQEIEMFVLDEADRMLDMGFLPDVRRVIGLLPQQRQTLLFSATMPDEIANLAQSILHDPVRVAVDPVSSTVDAIEQEVYFVSKENKRALLAQLIRSKKIQSALVFVRTKHGADKVARDLNRDGIRADSIHGDKTQTARQYALSSFKEGQTRVLVATDIAARGIDIDELGYVVNYDMPSPAENYVHRIGRTGRAGRSGMAFSFCDTSEYPYLLDIEKLTGKRIPVVSDHPYALEEPSVGRRGKKVKPVGRPEKGAPEADMDREDASGEKQVEKPKKPAQKQERAKKSAEKTERAEKAPQAEKPAVRSERAEKTPRADKPERAEAPARAPRQEKPERAAEAVPVRSERTSRQERSPRQRMNDKADRAADAVRTLAAKSDMSSFDRGLPSIRNSASPLKSGRVSVTVENYDQLPKPEPGHLLLNSFAETGIDYYMTENPDADNEAIESLGFYTPPAGALREIYGDEYDGTDPDFSLPSAYDPLPAGDEAAASGESGQRRRKRSRGKGRSGAGEERAAQPVSDAADTPSEAPLPEQPDASAAGAEQESGEGQGAPKKRRRPRRRRRPSGENAGDRPEGANEAAPDSAEAGRAASGEQDGGANADGGASGQKSGEQKQGGSRNRRPRRRRPSGSPAPASDDIRTKDAQPFYGAAE